MKIERIFKVGDKVKTKDGKVCTVTQLIEGDIFPKVIVITAPNQFVSSQFAYEEYYLRYVEPHGLVQTRNNAYLDLVEAKAKVLELEKTVASWDCLVEQYKSIPIAQAS